MPEVQVTLDQLKLWATRCAERSVYAEITDLIDDEEDMEPDDAWNQGQRSCS